jgi:hypothetical protein
VLLSLLCSSDHFQTQQHPPATHNTRGYVLYLTYKTVLVDGGWNEEVFKVCRMSSECLLACLLLHTGSVCLPSTPRHVLFEKQAPDAAQRQQQEP